MQLTESNHLKTSLGGNERVNSSIDLPRYRDFVKKLRLSLKGLPFNDSLEPFSLMLLFSFLVV